MTFSMKTGHLKQQIHRWAERRAYECTNSSGAHVGACRQREWGMLGFRSLWLHLPHIKKHWSYSRARPKPHTSGTRSVTSELFAIFITLTAWFLSLALAFAFKQHIQTHTVITTCRLSYPDLCALDCRAGLWCIVHYKPWFNSKNRKSPHKISVIHFDKLQQNKEILTELCLWVQPLWRSNMPSPLSIVEYILIYKNFSTH